MLDLTFANTTSENGFQESITVSIKGMGRLFYLHSPKDTIYERKEDVPNFFRQSWPYFLLFMIIEHLVLKLKGKSGIRLNDGITSISHGIFQECGRILWRGAESYLYTWIYVNYRIVDLPWNHMLTWYAAALGVDFCYYWMHRACHEIHILWAQHQVHHTSEDFNMGVGVRQSILQGWCGFLFYLPLALAIPPAQFVMHHQFSYIYMFWIHTETIRSLGPLEYILNTPSHHRVHHVIEDSNRPGESGQSIAQPFEEEMVEAGVTSPTRHHTLSPQRGARRAIRVRRLLRSPAQAPPHSARRAPRRHNIAEQFLNSDEQWRNLATQFVTENLRLREIELQQQSQWQTLFAKLIDLVKLLENKINK